MTAKGWYVLYRDGPGYGVRATDEFNAAIGTAWQLSREGRFVVQIGARDTQGLHQVLGAYEIGRICARMDKQGTPLIP